MIERCNRARFLFEPPAVLFGEPLHRDDAIEPRVARLPHFSHSTFAKLGKDLIRPDDLTNHHRQVLSLTSVDLP